MPKFKHLTDSLETTLSIIKPDGLCNRKAIVRRILKNGFCILYSKKIRLSPEQAANFLTDKEQDKNFNILVYHLSSGPIEILILSKSNAIKDLLALLGPVKPSEARKCFPNSIRAKFGDPTDDFRNAVHGSQTMDSARHEIHFFHPNFIYEPLDRVRPEDIESFRDIIDPLMKGLHCLTKQRPDDEEPITWLSEWLMENNKNVPIITAPADEDSMEQSSAACRSLNDSVSTISSSSLTFSSSSECSQESRSKNNVEVSGKTEPPEFVGPVKEHKICSDCGRLIAQWD